MGNPLLHNAGGLRQETGERRIGALARRRRTLTRVSGIALAFATLVAASAVEAQDTAASQGTAQPTQPAPLEVPPPPPDAELPAVEPVIPDAEFEATVPALDNADADLEGPLESIEDFERRVAAEQTAAAQQAGAAPTEGQTPPAGDAALADGDTQEVIGDAPITDTALTEPLPPLESFQVEEVQFTEAESDAEPVEVAYVVQVNGLEAVDDDSAANLTAMFDDLSALGEDDEAANVAQISARLTEDSALLKSILASEGWYDAAVTTRLDRTGEDNAAPLTAVLDVVPGQRYNFASINVNATPTVPDDLIASNLALEVGQPIIAERVQGAEAQVAVALPENGYPFAKVGQRDILLDPETGGGDYTLPIEVGPRSVFGGIRTTGNLAFDAEHIEVLSRFDRGELYDSRMVDDLRQALVATGLFNTVAVSPEQTGEDAGNGTQYATILVDQDAGPPRTIAGSAGYGTGQGVRVEGSWTHRNLFPPEGALIANAVLGTREQGAGVTFRRSNAGRRDRTFSLTAEALHSDYDAFEAYTGRLATLVTYDSTPIWQKRFTYAYGAQILGSVEEDFDFSINDLADRTFFIGGLTGQAGFDTSDDLLNPTSGFRLTALVEPEASLQDGFDTYLRARIDGSAYLPIGDSFVVAGRLRFGTIQGIDRFDLAPSRRFYAGGGGSVRGFGFQQLGPRVEYANPDFDPTDEDSDEPETLIRPIGGRSLVEGAAEVRYRFGNFGVVGFVDAGQVYTETYPTFDDIRIGVGVGARYYTNFGPLRVDIATPMARRRGESRLNLYISIGQAF
ncbi:BamA/TamA family outer membrane protein [Croceibacterium sp. TMG7-5b_MA50]|uniref:autotransporter assembly complex protein TamA n=1 Tax=Croceibacterium sp. TMG7-5b_MA50 TaxID=3121290 RepID=UPI0032219223